MPHTHGYTKGVSILLALDTEKSITAAMSANKSCAKNQSQQIGVAETSEDNENIAKISSEDFAEISGGDFKFFNGK